MQSVSRLTTTTGRAKLRIHFRSSLPFNNNLVHVEDGTVPGLDWIWSE